MYLSSPRGQSINDGILPSVCSLQYSSVDDAVDIIMQLGRYTELVKMDLSNAYQIVPVIPEDQPLLGIFWHGATYFNRALPFGLRSAPKVFTAVADLLTWILYCEGIQFEGIQFVLHYLDDFVLIGSPGSDDAARARALVDTTFSQIGASIAHHKTEGPSTLLSFQGIQVDTGQYQLSLPHDKVVRLQDLL